MAIAQTLNVNGKAVSITIDDPDMPLLYALRNNLGLRGPHFGCGLSQCGACTVHVDGATIRSCVFPLSSLQPGNKFVTLEGLGTPENPHRTEGRKPRTAAVREYRASVPVCFGAPALRAAYTISKQLGFHSASHGDLI